MNADTDWVGGRTFFRGLCMVGKVERGACLGLRADRFRAGLKFYLQWRKDAWTCNGYCLGEFLNDLQNPLERLLTFQFHKGCDMRPAIDAA